MKRLSLCLPLLFLASSALAQVPAAPVAGTNVQVDPLRCWWRTSAGAVRVGEVFDVSLTCAVLESEAVQVMPDESRLGVAVVQLAPFEVVGGTHPADLRSGSRRFFQYQYRLRVISPDAIGKDLGLPPMTIHYAINSRVATSTSVQGRDLVYVLPPQSVKVASMVPSDATDIRDAGGEDFSRVETFQFRASVLEVIALTCIALGVLMTLIMVVALARRTRSRTPEDERLLSTRALLGTAATALRAVQRERDQQGWSDVLAGRALAATRLAATCAIGATANQYLAPSGVEAGEGRLISSGGLRGKSRVVSGSTTTNDVARAIAAATGAAAMRLPMLEALRTALSAFTATQYARDVKSEQGELDTALSSAVSATNQVRGEHSWLKTVMKQIRTGGAPAATRA